MRFLRRGGPISQSPDPLEIAPPSADADRVRAALIAAYRAGDGARLLELCRANADLIEGEFPGWWEARPPIDGASGEEYVQVLGNVAMAFNEVLGRPALLQRAAGPPEDNPVLQIQAALRKGEALRQAGQSEEAAAVGAEVVARLDSFKATRHMEEERAQALYLIGAHAFVSGHVPAAVEPMAEARRLYQVDGLAHALPLLLDLFDVYRYLGRAAEAADVSDELAAGFEQGSDVARFYGRQAAILRTGEPRLRVIARIAGGRYELPDAPAVIRAGNGPGQRVSFEYRRNRPSIDRSAEATRRGMELASRSRHDQALEAFAEASAIDPFDPHPFYQAGVVGIDRGDWAAARAAFEATEERAPGWFYARRYRWLAERVEEGLVDPRIGAVLIRIDDDALPPVERRRLLAPALAAAPEFAWLRLHQGSALLAEGRRRDAENEFREGLEGEADDDVRSSLLVALATLLGARTEEGRRLHEDALMLDGNLLAQASGRVSLALAATPR